VKGNRFGAQYVESIKEVITSTVFFFHERIIMRNLPLFYSGKYGRGGNKACTLSQFLGITRQDNFEMTNFTLSH